MKYIRKIFVLFLFLNFNFSIFSSDAKKFNAEISFVTIMKKERKDAELFDNGLTRASLNKISPYIEQYILKGENLCRIPISRVYIKLIYLITQHSHDIPTIEKIFIKDGLQKLKNNKEKIKFLFELIKSISFLESNINEEVIDLFFRKIFELRDETKFDAIELFKEFDTEEYLLKYKDQFKKYLLEKIKFQYKPVPIARVNLPIYNEISILLFSPDSSLLLIDGDDKFNTVMYDVNSFKKLFILTIYDKLHIMTNPYLTKFSYDSRWFVRVSPNAVTLYNAKNGKEEIFLLESDVQNVIFSPDSTKLLLQKSDNFLIYDISKKKKDEILFQISAQDKLFNKIKKIMFSPSGNLLFIESLSKKIIYRPNSKLWSESKESINKIIVININTGENLFSIEKEEPFFPGSCFLSDTQLLINHGQELIKYDIQNRDESPIKISQEHTNINTVFIVPNNKLLIKLLDNCILYDLNTKKYSYIFKENYFNLENKIQEVKVSPCGRELLVRSENKVIVYDFEKKEPILLIEKGEADEQHNRNIFAATFSPTGAQLITQSVDKTIIHTISDHHDIFNYFIRNQGYCYSLSLSSKEIELKRYEISTIEHQISSFEEEVVKFKRRLLKEFSVEDIYNILKFLFSEKMPSYFNLQLNKEELKKYEIQLNEEIFEEKKEKKKKEKNEKEIKENIVAGSFTPEERDEFFASKYELFRGEVSEEARKYSEQKVVYEPRVELWYSDPDKRIEQDYNSPNAEQFKKNLLKKYGKDSIVFNHQFPKILDYFLIGGYEQFKAFFHKKTNKYSLQVPGYYNSLINPEKPRRFGFFEITYELDGNIKKVYHRFFREVETFDDLLKARQSTITEEIIINKEADILTKDFNGWKIDRKGEDDWKAYLMKEDEGILLFKNPVIENPFYVLLPCLLEKE